MRSNNYCKYLMKLEERAFRRKANRDTKQGKEIIGIATYGDYQA